MAPNYWLAISLTLRDTEQISRKRQGACRLQNVAAARLTLVEKREVMVKVTGETTYTGFADFIFRPESSPSREGVPGRLKRSTEPMRRYRFNSAGYSVEDSNTEANFALAAHVDCASRHARISTPGAWAECHPPLPPESRSGTQRRHAAATSVRITGRPVMGDCTFPVCSR
jgi:hypothetical protein